ncbi:MAG: sugar phosphate nucleotidyltransferase [Fermentimonas sp.]|nr:sugar phosphate nucleotidyltransferase [Fermentimonas sp.]
MKLSWAKQTVKDEDVSKYDIVNGDRVYTIKDLVEKPTIGETPSNVAILGRYIITLGIFDILAGTKPGKGGEIQLTDALKVLAGRKDMYAYDFIGKRYDVGNTVPRGRGYWHIIKKSKWSSGIADCVNISSKLIAKASHSQNKSTKTF